MVPPAAAHHGVAAFVNESVAGTGVLPETVESAVRDEALRAAMLSQQVQADLGRIAGALDDAGVPFLVLKGPVLDKWVYRHRGRRAYNDLDVLVPPAHLGHAVRVLEGDGSVLLDRNWDMMLARLPGEVHLLAPMGTVVDLHWHVINSASMRHVFSIDGDALTEHMHRVPLGGSEIPTLAPAAMLIHVALHACHSGADRLIWLKDVEQCATAPELDWGQVIALTEQWNLTQPLALVLTRTSHLLGLEVPRSAATHLGVGRGYCRLSRWADRAVPVLGTSQSRSPGRLVARATRRDTRESLSALLGKTIRAASELGRSDGNRINRDPGDPGSPLYASGTDHDRDAFFRRVASTSGHVPLVDLEQGTESP